MSVFTRFLVGHGIKGVLLFYFWKYEEQPTSYSTIPQNCTTTDRNENSILLWGLKVLNDHWGNIYIYKTDTERMSIKCKVSAYFYMLHLGRYNLSSGIILGIQTCLFVWVLNECFITTPWCQNASGNSANPPPPPFLTADLGYPVERTRWKMGVLKGSAGLGSS